MTVYKTFRLEKLFFHSIDGFMNGLQGLITFLKSCEIFTNLSHDELVLMLPFIRVMTFEKGEWVLKEGDVGQNLYLVKKGKVEVVKSEKEHGHIEQLDVLGPGEWVGEMAYFEGGKRSASVRALEKVEILVLLVEDLRSSSVGEVFYPKIVKHLTTRISQRLRKTGDSLLDSVTEKLRLVKASNQLSSAIIHLMILFALFINISKVVVSNAEEFPTLNVLFPSISILAFGASAIWLIRTSDYPLSFYGLTFDKWHKQAWEGLLWTIPLLVFVTFLKWGLIFFVPEFEDLWLFDSPFKHVRIGDMLFYVGIYLVLVPLQELVARGFLQSCFRNFFQGPYRVFFAILTSNLFFEMPHTIHHLSFAIATFCFGIFWGYMFERQKSLVGVCVSHALVGAWVFFVLNYEVMFDAVG